VRHSRAAVRRGVLGGRERAAMIYDVLIIMLMCAVVAVVATTGGGDA
jgi:hypothetical protein